MADVTGAQIRDYQQTHSPAEFVAKAQDLGLTLSDIQRKAGYSDSDVQQWMESTGYTAADFPGGTGGVTGPAVLNGNPTPTPTTTAAPIPTPATPAPAELPPPSASIGAFADVAGGADNISTAPVSMIDRMMAAFSAHKSALVIVAAAAAGLFVYRASKGRR